MNGHGGQVGKLARQAGIPSARLLDFSANINPLGPPSGLRLAAIRALEDAALHYPDAECAELADRLCETWGCRPAELVVSNGASEALYALPRALAATARRAVLVSPCYIDYRNAVAAADWEVRIHQLVPENDFQIDWPRLAQDLQPGEILFLGRPNNPTGSGFATAPLRKLAAACPRNWLVIDESFIEFTDEESLAADLPANCIVLRSLTKFYAMPGLRLGAVIAPAEVAARLRRLLPPWSVNTVAQQAGLAALADSEFAVRSREAVRLLRQELAAGLQKIPGLRVLASEANFLLCRLERSGDDAASLAARLLAAHAIAIRVCDNYDGLDKRWFRIAVRTQEENGRLLAALHAELAVAAPAILHPARRRTPAIMFQGTSSNAGKSVLTAAMCRILLQDGYRVAPFKSQNMSLNSFVTRDGGEMGRAQVVQAQACRLEPDVRMNPVLLKPNSDTGSQVIVMGRPVGNMRVNEYISFKPEAALAAHRAYDELAAAHDVIVLEGAGSPGEVNLKRHDIVNMTMARHAQAPVLLVGDIDRGGVFASFVGTLEVLDAWERALVAGFVVNRFRGQESLLQDALDYMRRHTGRPVLGVVPYLRDLGLPEEDSVSFKSGEDDPVRSGNPAVEIAVIDLPHLSNFTDLDALRLEPGLHLRIVRSVADLGTPDAVLIPGSKNTLGDLAWLYESGLAARIQALAAGGTEIIGICGGFQMLGREVSDLGCVESGIGRLAGLGLLDVQTVMMPEKTLRRAIARHAPSGLEVVGYEIHHGKTTGGAGTTPCFVRADGEIVGVAAASGKIWGTYLHGVFDADAFRHEFLNRLRRQRGLPAMASQASYGIDAALDRLADTVRERLKMQEIYRIMGLK